ncbi:MAG: hypothetical protein NC924_07285 [Candidatus Omnitrophica bacterium]|nr:hypothetical protein [Candidatus Omnitrophota bacterium]
MAEAMGIAGMRREAMRDDEPTAQALALLAAAGTGRSLLLFGGSAASMAEIAMRISSAAVCRQPVRIDALPYPCGDCAECLLAAQRQHPDILWIAPRQGSTKISIEESRMVREGAALKPYQAARKVFIFEQAQRLTAEAANALLKILEEPPANAVFILVAESSAHVLPTVVSRCHPLRCGIESVVAEKAAYAEVIGRIFEAPEAAVLNGVYGELSRLTRRDIELVVQELSGICRDLAVWQYRSAGVLLLSSQPPERLGVWSGVLPAAGAAAACEELTEVLSAVAANANVKMCVDRALKAVVRRRDNARIGR